MAHRGPRQVEEVYTIKQVEALTGVSANTIRSWERRHGFPSPQRTGSNYRAYTADDISRIRIVRGARDRGQTFEQAIHALDHSPRIAVVDGDQRRHPQPVPPADSSTAERLAMALIETRFEQANDMLGATLLTTTVEDVCFQHLLPVDRDIARRAAAGAVSHFRAALAREWIRRKLVHAFAASSPDAGNRLAAVIAMIDAQETTLSLCHAINLSRAGYGVFWIGDGAGVIDVEDLVSDMNPAVIVLTGAGPLAEAAIEAAVDRLVQLRIEGWNGVITRTDATGDTSALITLPPDASLAREAIDRADPAPSDLHIVREL